MDFDNIKGKQLLDVRLESNKERIVFEFCDGTAFSYGVEGDCCSNSWIEHLELPGFVAGATLLDVIDSGSVTQDHNEHDEANGGDSISVYNTVFRTDRGDIVLEFRNSSNGYYGGYLVAAGPPTPRPPATDLEIALRKQVFAGVPGAAEVLRDHLLEIGATRG